MNCRIPSALVLGAFLLAIPCGAVPPAEWGDESVRFQETDSHWWDIP